MEIRRLYPGDDALVKRIAEDVLDEPVRADRLAAYLASPGHLMIVALADGVVVGQCAAIIHRHPDKVTELYIDEVGVSPAFQRHGIARKMLDAMFALGREQGCGEAWVGTEPDNVPGGALYESREEVHGPAESFVMYVYEL
ncbi:GNAT family N-acetyltransferase [Mesorhizobium sp. M0772]|uniref:GNAT family N-acetyltransferase n=1 Tax=Mesorhizobium sp. M0772 TaxID=2956998 RepID=UPI0033385BA2